MKSIFTARCTQFDEKTPDLIRLKASVFRGPGSERSQQPQLRRLADAHDLEVGRPGPAGKFLCLLDLLFDKASFIDQFVGEGLIGIVINQPLRSASGPPPAQCPGLADAGRLCGQYQSSRRPGRGVFPSAMQADPPVGAAPRPPGQPAQLPSILSQGLVQEV